MSSWAELSNMQRHALYRDDRAEYERLRTEHQIGRTVPRTSLRWQGKSFSALSEQERDALAREDSAQFEAMLRETRAVAFETLTARERAALAKSAPASFAVLHKAHAERTAASKRAPVVASSNAPATRQRLELAHARRGRLDG